MNKKNETRNMEGILYYTILNYAILFYTIPYLYDTVPILYLYHIVAIYNILWEGKS